MTICRISCSPADCADSRDKTHPIAEENKNEDAGEKPKRMRNEITADDALEKVAQPFHQPFPKILRTGWNFLNPAGRDSGKNDDHEGNNPRNDHRTCDWDGTDMTNLERRLRQAFFMAGFLRSPGSGSFIVTQFGREK